MVNAGNCNRKITAPINTGSGSATRRTEVGIPPGESSFPPKISSDLVSWPFGI